MKSIFVTGAASGIGKATSLLFARRGFKVGCYDIDVDGARKVAEEIGPGTSYGRLDVTNGESWKAAVDDFAAAAAERLDVLFNCAGVLRYGHFEDIPPADCKRQLDVNVMGVIHGIYTCLPLLEKSAKLETNGSAIVNMSSASAVYGQPELAVYSATKFAVRAITEALDVEFRPKGIRVCDIMPGYVDTPMVHNEKHRPKSLDRMGIKLKPEDVAEVVWNAAHGRSLHYIPQTDVALMSRASGLLPELGRVVMHRLSRSP